MKSYALAALFFLANSAHSEKAICLNKSLGYRSPLPIAIVPALLGGAARESADKELGDQKIIKISADKLGRVGQTGEFQYVMRAGAAAGVENTFKVYVKEKTAFAVAAHFGAPRRTEPVILTFSTSANIVDAECTINSIM